MKNIMQFCLGMKKEKYAYHYWQKCRCLPQSFDTESTICIVIQAILGHLNHLIYPFTSHTIWWYLYWISNEASLYLLPSFLQNKKNIPIYITCFSLELRSWKSNFSMARCDFSDIYKGSNGKKLRKTIADQHLQSGGSPKLKTSFSLIEPTVGIVRIEEWKCFQRNYCCNLSRPCPQIWLCWEI